MRSWHLKPSSIFHISKCRKISRISQPQLHNASISSDNLILLIMTGQVWKWNSSSSRRLVISSLYTKWKNSRPNSMKPWQQSATFSPTGISPFSVRELKNYSTRSYLLNSWWRSWSNARRNGCTCKTFLLLKILRSNWWWKLVIFNKLINTWRT